MHTWYYAVCDAHKEMCHVLVTSTFHIQSERFLNDAKYYPKDGEGNAIVRWLSTHAGCSLRLVHHDSQLEPLWFDYKHL